MKKLNKATVILIASMLVLALTLVATFSWFPRVFGYDTTKNYNKLDVKPAQVFVKSEPTKTESYLCEFVDGKINDATKGNTKGESIPLSTQESVTVKAGECKYFKTIVTYNTNVTHDNVTVSGLTLSGTTTDIKVCSLYPMKTVKDYSAGMAVGEHITVDSTSKTAVVEWYMYNSSSSGEQTLTITALPTAFANG